MVEHLYNRNIPAIYGVTIYNDGTHIAEIIENDKWNSSTTGAYCNYNNTNNLSTIATYSHLYNWYAVNTGKLAPGLARPYSR